MQQNARPSTDDVATYVAIGAAAGALGGAVDLAGRLASVQRIAALVAGGAIVLTDVPAGDLAAVTARLRAGVTDVVTCPVRSDDLIRKLTRARRA